MVLGERIKRIRTFRDLAQPESGLKLGYEERNADVRIAQYESCYRVLKNNTLMEMAKILHIDYIHFIGVVLLPAAPKILCSHYFGLMKMTNARSICFSLSAIPAKPIILMIDLSATTTMMTGSLIHQ